MECTKNTKRVKLYVTGKSEQEIMMEHNEDKLESTSEANLNAKTCSQTGRSPSVSSNESNNNTLTS